MSRTRLYQIAFVSLLIALYVVSAQAQSVTATKPPTVSKTDFALYSAVAASRALDFASTERCLHSTACHELELPKVIVGNRAAFGAFEAASAGIAIWSGYELRKHGHLHLAQLTEAINISTATGAAIHNYSIPVARKK